MSPSKNISCEIDDNFGPSAITSTLCLTISPPKSVTLKTDSSLTECTGVNCLSNAGTDTPTLAYGQSITLGPFTCASSTAGVKCTLASGDGFLISSSAITALGNAKVAAALELSLGSLPETGRGQLCCGSLEVRSTESPLLWVLGPDPTLTATGVAAGCSGPAEVTT